MVGLLPLCAATTFDGRTAGEVPRTRGAVPVVPRRAARAVRRDPRPEEARRRRPPARLDPGRDQAPPRAGEDARRERVPQRLTASARCRATTPSIPTSSTPAARNTASPTCRRSPTPACSAATRTGAGPIWMPVNALIIRALLQYYTYYGDDFTVECPTGSGRQMNLYQVAEEIARRLGEHLPARTRTAGGRSTAAPGSSRRTRTGAIASCSTSTSTATTGPASAPAIRPAGPGVIARTMHLFATLTPEQALEGGKKAYFESAVPERSSLIRLPVDSDLSSSRRPGSMATRPWTPQISSPCST